MTARFAGSRHLDQRRRRRIAQEAAPSPVQRRAPVPSAKTDEIDEFPEETGFSVPNPDESLIPRSRWKVAAVCVAGLVCWAGMLWVGGDSAWKGTALEEVVDLQSGRLAKFFSTVTLLGASQLATLILWYRSKSRKDFAGRYRIWVWASIYWSVLCLGAATGFHRPLAGMLYDYWRVECWRPHTVYWLGPSAAGFVALYTLLGRELRQSPASRVLWDLCALCGIAVCLLALGADVSVPAEVRLSVDVGAVTLWHYLAAATFLVHARFVVHVNKEAAPKLKPMPNRMVVWYLGVVRRLLTVRLPRFSFRLKSTVSSGAEEEKRDSKPRRRKQAIVATAEPTSHRDLKPANEETRLGPTSTKTSLPGASAGAKTLASSQPNRKLRIDPPQSPVPAPKAEPHSASVSSSSVEADSDDWSPAESDQDLRDDFDDMDFSKLSRKERRQLRKLRKTEGR